MAIEATHLRGTFNKAAEIGRLANFDPSVLENVNKRVLAAEGHPSLLQILDDTTVKLDRDSPVTFTSPEAIRLMGGLIAERAVQRPAVYRKYGILHEIKDTSLWGRAFVKTVTEVENTLAPRRKSPITTVSRRGGKKLGIPHIVVVDLRAAQVKPIRSARTEFRTPNIATALLKPPEAKLTARLFENLEPSEWRLKASCRNSDPAIFYPPIVFEPKSERLEREAQAKAICQCCPVKNKCLATALSNKETHGVWGGLNEDERELRVAAG